MTDDVTPTAQAAALNRRLEQLAADGEWRQMVDTMSRRDELLARLPKAERGQALIAAKRCTDRLRTLVSAAKSECADELSTLKRGRRAAASYRAHR